jgi:hypothetical protein
MFGEDFHDKNTGIAIAFGQHATGTPWMRMSVGDKITTAYFTPDGKLKQLVAHDDVADEPNAPPAPEPDPPPVAVADLAPVSVSGDPTVDTLMRMSWEQLEKWKTDQDAKSEVDPATRPQYDP